MPAGGEASFLPPPKIQFGSMGQTRLRSPTQPLGGVLVVIVALRFILDEFKLSKGGHLSGFLSKVPGTEQKHALQTNTVQYLQK